MVEIFSSFYYLFCDFVHLACVINVTLEVMFVGVEFHDDEGGGLALINEKWLTPRKNQTWWPPHKHSDKLNKSLRKGDTPQTDTWKLYKLKRSFFKERDFTKAQKKLKSAEYNSDIQTEAEVCIQKRKVKRPRRLEESDSSDDSVFETSPIFNKKTFIEKVSASTQLNEGVAVLKHCSSINLEQTDLSGSNNSPNYQDSTNTNGKFL
ncbi:hypothetical protein RN001_008552 [Aquatica leii]|uniref:Uncharacterized protein n=1 Tax=Aquatica leii TaxID=1421715 RepID=A0AAN7PDF6_9COLE|nr:hypothetical protein RN001_008552 [Aquatica leii]